ncbi:hypothetical protein N8590_03660, partial [bacterium]|nr:hypothetical protein [bacterium]
MRSANKKHGNIGDIELIKSQNGLEILESWDAKYGKLYLRDELEELAEKLGDHSETKIAGFVVDENPNLKKEIVDRKAELEELLDVTIHICSFEQWTALISARAEGVSQSDLAKRWLSAFVESICQRRRDKAPIDEPCEAWLTELNHQLTRWIPQK